MFSIGALAICVNAIVTVESFIQTASWGRRNITVLLLGAGATIMSGGALVISVLTYLRS